MTTPPDRYLPRGEWNWTEWKREEPTPETIALCAILSEAVRQFEKDMLLRKNALAMPPTKRHHRSLYMERLIDAVYKGSMTTYICQTKQEAEKLKHEIEAVDSQIRKEFGI